MENELRKLGRKARRSGMAIRKDRATGGYLVIDLHLNAVIAGPMVLEDVESCLEEAEA